MEVVVVTNRKGGTGKTCTTQALGVGLRKYRDAKVLFVDLDSQANLSYALGAEGRYTSMDVLRGSVTAKQAIQTTEQGDIIAGSEMLAGADTVITDTGKQYRLKEALAGLDYDYVIIDTSAALGTLTINALSAATCAVIPASADLYCMQAIGQLHKAITAVKKQANPNLYINGILLTRYNSRAVISRDMQNNLQTLAERLDTSLYTRPIRECIAIREAQASRQDIFSYAPRSNAAVDYTSFVVEFIERNIRK